VNDLVTFWFRTFMIFIHTTIGVLFVMKTLKDEWYMLVNGLIKCAY